MLRKVFQGFCKNRRGRFVIAGAIGVLAGVGRLLASQTPCEIDRRPISPKLPDPPQALDRFTIQRTKSELGYVYWVLQGFGRYQGFTLFDTWREAMDEAARRLFHAGRVPKMPDDFVVTSSTG